MIVCSVRGISGVIKYDVVNSYILLFTNVVTKAMSHLFFSSETIIMVTLKIMYTIGTSLTELRFFFPQSSSFLTHFFHLYVRHCLPFTWNSVLKHWSSSGNLCFRLSFSIKWCTWSASCREPKWCKSEGA